MAGVAAVLSRWVLQLSLSLRLGVGFVGYDNRAVVTVSAVRTGRPLGSLTALTVRLLH